MCPSQLDNNARVPPWRLDMVSLRKSFWPAATLVAALAIAPATAQSTGITLTGVVRNASNAPIAGATVTATNKETRASETVTAGADGGYSFSLPPGKYSVAVSASGF